MDLEVFSLVYSNSPLRVKGIREPLKELWVDEHAED